MVHKYTEVTQTEELHTEESVASQGIKSLKQQIDDEALPNATLVSVSDSYETIDETTVAVTVKAEYIEDIAQKTKGEKVTQEAEENGASSTEKT